MAESAKPVNLKIGVLIKIDLARITSIAIAVTFLASCAAEPVSTEGLMSFAVITSGDTVSYASAGSGPTISIVEVDGKPVDRPYGPIHLEPGTHSVTMKCDGSNRTSSITVSAGEVYQFNKVITPGVKGCAGSLSRVH